MNEMNGSKAAGGQKSRLVGLNGARTWTAGVALGLLPLSAAGQMHKVTAPEKVTRAVALYEFVGDPLKPRAARLIPISLFIGGQFEDAGVYLARPIPFALDTGIRYELQQSGAPKDFFDVVASRNFAGSEAAANLPFDDGWFGYGRVSVPAAPKAGRVRANCGNAHVVQETPRDDGKPHFGSKSADPKAAAAAIPKECIDEEPSPKVTLDEYSKKDKDAADPERPTLHRSPESTANNTGAESKGDKKNKKDNKPPAATVSQNSSPGDDPDRPVIRHRSVDEDDPNALPPDPMELASRASSSTASKTVSGATDARSAANQTVAEGGTIESGDTMTGGPVLRRGKVTAPKDDVQAVVKPHAAATAGTSLAAPLDSFVAVSDAKERPQHTYAYSFSSATERAAAVTALEELARAVVLNPALATDAPAGTVAPPAPRAAAPPTRTVARSRTGVRMRPKAVATAVPASVTFADETVKPYQLYFSAPVSYTFFARVPATGSTPERYVTVVASTDPDGTLHPAMRTVTDAQHLDRVPRYRPIDVVDADGTNRASILMEVRGQSARTFALYRLLGNKTEQVFVTGTTLL